MTTAHLRNVIDYYERISSAAYFGAKTSNALDIMFPRMRSMLDVPEEREKLMRWLGFLQGIFFCEGLFTIDQMRTHNRKGGPYDV